MVPLIEVILILVEDDGVLDQAVALKINSRSFFAIFRHREDRKIIKLHSEGREVRRHNVRDPIDWHR